MNVSNVPIFFAVPRVVMRAIEYVEYVASPARRPVNRVVTGNVASHPASNRASATRRAQGMQRMPVSPGMRTPPAKTSDHSPQRRRHLCNSCRRKLMLDAAMTVDVAEILSDMASPRKH